jgi:LEA14-like dessication related protein
MPPLPRTLAGLAAGVLLASGIGCGSSSYEAVESAPAVPFDQPDVALRDVRLRGVGLIGGAFDVELRVYNPNDYDLQAPRVNYRIMLDDVQVATGFTDLDVVVPGRDSTVVRVPAAFSYAGLGRAGRAMLNMGAAPYRVLGRITVGTPYGRLTFPYDRAGQFSTINVQRQR